MSDSNYPEDMNLTVAYLSGVAKGKEDERAKIVAWLRDPYQSDDDNLGIYFANEIEAGEHLK